MLQKMSPTVQRAWLEKVVANMQPNDKMHAAAPQAVLLEWTAAACKDDTTPANHIANLARYWIHHSLVKGAATNALRFIGGRVN